MSHKFWKPGSEGPVSRLKEERTGTGFVNEGCGTGLWYNSHHSLSLQQQRQRLPIFKYRTHILYLAETFQTVIVVGETGCGKSTQIPQYLHEAGWNVGNKIIGVVLPRRVAVTTVATRVAEEKGAVLGDVVGYTVRFDDVSDPLRTRIKFLTDGILIRELMTDPLLTRYSVLMVDEAHERTLYTDIILGLLKKIIRRRKDLHVIIASATLDAEKFQKFFNVNASGDRSKDTSSIISVEGRLHPVRIFYKMEPVANYATAAVDTAVEIHEKEERGDILVFLTGMEEVEDACRLLRDRASDLPKKAGQLQVLPMYSTLPLTEQLKVFHRAPEHTRKVIVSTNIAEASLTIPGIVFVIDPGFVKIPAFNPKTNVDCLVVIPISKASAKQRAGRAGRMRSGKAYRLFPESAFDDLEDATVPEIQRSNLAPVVLQLKALGIKNILRFDFIAAPPSENMISALELLYALGALDDDGELTQPLGENMAEFPLHPMFAKILLSSNDYGCTHEIVSIVAMLQVQNVFINPYKGQQKISAERNKRKFCVKEGDHLSLLNVFTTFMKKKKDSTWCRHHYLNYRGLCRAAEIREQLVKQLKRFNVKIDSIGQAPPEDILRCLTSGFFANAARFQLSGHYVTIRDDYPLHIHPTSVIYGENPPAFVIYNELVQTDKVYMRDISVIQPEWLYTLAPHYYQFGTDRERYQLQFTEAGSKRRKMVDDE